MERSSYCNKRAVGNDKYRVMMELTFGAFLPSSLCRQRMFGSPRESLFLLHKGGDKRLILIDATSVPDHF